MEPDSNAWRSRKWQMIWYWMKYCGMTWLDLFIFRKCQLQAGRAHLRRIDTATKVLPSEQGKRKQEISTRDMRCDDSRPMCLAGRRMPKAS